ncbi:MAG: zinc ribbon domain-containing protein [Verrucomicrobia bacterium]|nr:zinc ribbon domain-containing protein [Verrucomicrobiota bacterium]MBS0636572.1 zinc ribbon domain-containing protein [Verrucomicrobiota bacterium]
MPTYRYRCETCKQEEEIVQRISDPALTSCPHCHKETYKRIPPKEVAIQFKGSGFYITDYNNPKKDNGGCGSGSCGCH